MSKKVCYITVIDRVIKYFAYPHINASLEAGYEVTCISDFSDEHALDGLTGPVKTIQTHISRSVNPINMLKNIFFLRKVFKENRFDMIQYTGPSTALICSLAAKWAKVPVKQYCLWGIRYEGFAGGIKRKVFKLLEKITCKNSDFVILDSPSNRQFAIQEGLITAEKSCVIGEGSASGIDLSVYDHAKKSEFRQNIRQKFQVPEEAFVFGYVGRLSQEKGINELLQAARELLDGHEDIVLMLVGFTEQDKALDETLLTWAEQEKRIVFCGRIDRPEQCYAAFDAFVFPSYREGYGGGCIQAGAFGVPSVVSDIRSLLDSLDDGQYGLSFPLGDAGALARQMEAYYLDRELTARMGEQMRRRVEEKFEIHHWMQLYREHNQVLLKDVEP